MFQICRTCLQHIINNTSFSTTIYSKLSSCVPELDLNLAPNAVVCSDCIAAINSAYKFKIRCLLTEMEILKYIKQERCVATSVDLVQVMQLNQAEAGDLIDATIKMEDHEAASWDLNTTEEAYKWENEYKARQDCVLQHEVVDMESKLFKTDDNFVSCGIFSEQDNFNSRTEVDIFHKCYICGHRSSTKTKLNLHLRIHASKRYKRKISKKSDLQNRSLVKNYKCRMCTYFTKYKSVLATHVRGHLTKQLYKQVFKSIQRTRFVDCIKFVKGFRGTRFTNYRNKRSSKYLKHMYAKKRSIVKYKYLPNAGENRHKCAQCKDCSTTLNILKRHIMTHAGAKLFKCADCDYRTLRKYLLKRHMVIHTGAKPFKCAMCKFRSGRKSDLKRHVMIHTGNKPFKCTKCEYKTSQKGHLKEHMSIHTGEKPLKCTICEYKTNWKDALKSHMLIHTGNKPFKCTECEYKTVWKGALKSHMMIHTGSKPFKCTNCEFSTIRKGDLKRHMIIHIRKTLVSVQSSV